MDETNDSGLNIKPLPKLGQEVGRFLIERELPRGGQARVYRAWQTDLQRAVALKLLPSSYAADDDAAARFKREIENVGRISHPNIVRVYEAGDIDGHPYFTMEFLEGQDAETIIKKGPLDPDEAASLIEAVARAVQEAHSAGIVHRDIKPGNIILRKDDTPVLTDFGLAQDLSHSAQLTRTGVSMGTPAYMAPEQARGERNRVGKKSDIYALGATLYSLLTGKRPVDGDSAYELMIKVAESTGPKWPRQAVEDVPADLRAIVEMAMQNDPAKRYDSATALADDLERFMHGEWVAARTRSPITKAWVRARRYVPVAAVVVLAVALAAGMVYTGLNPTAAENTQGALIDESGLLGDFESAGEDLEGVFEREGEGTWTKSGASVHRGPTGELVLTRTGEEPLLISPRRPICWGDFTIQIEFQVSAADGALEFLIGMPDAAAPARSAYGIALGARSRDRYELRRLGVGVYSGHRIDGAPLLADGVWYRARVGRTGPQLDFTLMEVATGLQVASFSHLDDFPALVSGEDEHGTFTRQRFGIVGEVASLSVRDATISHHDNAHGTEALLYSVGQYSEAELRVSARLATPLPDGASLEARNARAALYYLRARCRLALGLNEAAAEDIGEAKQAVVDSELRARAFLLGSRLETQRGDDAGALAQIRVARFNAPAGMNSMIFHDAYARGVELQAAEPARAMLYFDYVAANALGSPWLVCDSLYRAAMLRLESEPDRAIELLERIESANYQRFGGTFAPAMLALFDLRWQQLATVPATIELIESAEWLAESVNGYEVNNAELIPALVRAAWLARLAAEPENATLLSQAAAWLTAAEQAGSDGVWLDFQRALMLEERPEQSGGTEARIRAWRGLAEQLELDDPRHGVLSAVSEYFIGSPVDNDDIKRRGDVLRRALRRELADVPAHWFGDASADHMADYLIALYEAPGAREAAVTRLESTASGSDAGVLVLLKARADRWLPVPR